MATKRNASKSKATPARKGGAQPDAIALLKKDHETVRGLLEQATKSTGARRSKLLATIEKEVKVHSQVEEEIFYPAFRDAVKKKDDRKLYFEALEEHHVVDMVMPEVEDGTGDEVAAKVKVLKELIEHHADEEEESMFPKARKVLDRDELRELGARMAARKEQLAG